MSDQMLQKIESFLEGVSLKSIVLSAKKISDDYRFLGKRKTVRDADREDEILAYLVTRMPATYAALYHVFQELKRRFPHFSPSSLLDVGSGPGTTLWAAAELFPELEGVQCLENDAYFLSMAKRLSEDLWLYPHVQWMQADMKKDFVSQQCDLVVASYSLGEINDADRGVLIDKLWGMTKKVFIAIEPGTPKGFERLRAMRKQLLQSGGYLLAPCPHSEECPLKGGDWCHFYARLNRTSMHRRAKEGELNYEDEKFSYFIFSKDPLPQSQSRIVRHPRKGKGHVQLTLCKPEGIEDVVVSKKDKDLYSIAKKSQWGDSLELP